ncbi:hypothetical protein BU15DRAFT_79361 [Melanogaster broomeanus]|nr:hypothetical protein BU15DRAFT_79361 [Melanogaster broomeanus]
MASKIKISGTKKAGSSKARTKVGETLLLDSRGIGEAQLDDKVQANKKLEEQARKAVIGLGRGTNEPSAKREPTYFVLLHSSDPFLW